ncbi:MAG: type VI secretion system tip protein VgrG, partial [Rhodothermales bacterium]|nr:type VI secretion system tip protein VgrG [Rhodothermales bacterium]
MVVISHDNRAVRVDTALPSNELLFKSLNGQDGLSTLFDYQLDLVTDSASIDLNDLLGTEMLVSVDLVRGGERYFHGHVSHCALIGSDNGYLHYQFSLKPWFWFLTRTSDCRIFQQMSVPDIIEKVFRDEGFTDFELRLTSTYEAREYFVQYQETDFNFVSRLMEEVGIYYYFIHSSDSHMMILCDSFCAHEPYEGYENVRYHEAGNELSIDEDHIDTWGFERQLQPGKIASQDYCFKDPKADLLVGHQLDKGHARSDYEVYEYPGSYRKRADGESLVKNRLEESHAQFEVFSGSGDVNGLCSGFLFSLTDNILSEQNREYLVRDASYKITMDDYTSGGDGVFDFKSTFHAIISDQQFRAARTSPKPCVQGPQTAKVVGPCTEEIWTDEFGRVKLQFHWDRYGSSDENSSCWVRVSQVWAGSGWGAMHIPRIGQEVIVECLEGDPDRPIVTGRVYNGDNPVPYKLPENKTQSGIKSRS